MRYCICRKFCVILHQNFNIIIVVKVNYLKSRHIGLSLAEKQAMLSTIGIEVSNDAVSVEQGMEQLVSQVMPSDIRLSAPLELDEPMTEQEHLDSMADLASRNRVFKSYIGRGWYGSITPAVIQRNVLENPVWYTSYTPYQAEVSQGRLEALFVFQTLVSDLTGLPLSNCSLLDEATSAAEAITMMRNLRTREQVKNNVCKVFVDQNMFANTLSVIRTRATGQNIEVVVGNWVDFQPTTEYFGVLVQYPNADGSVEDYTDWVGECHAAGLKVAVVADLLSLALLPAPGQWGADIVCGTAQRLGLPMGFGGPTAGYMASRDEFKRDMPGRIIGRSVDANGRPAYRLALQTREQHIKREKATSNICTAEALSAMMVGFYGVYHGAEGLREIAEGIHNKAAYLSEMLQAYGYAQENTEFFDTLKIRMPEHLTIDNLRRLALDKQINLYYDTDWVGLSIDETTTVDDMNNLIELFAEAIGNMAQYIASEDDVEGVWAIDESHVREVDYLNADVFKFYHTETEMMRYIKSLDRKDISLTHTMIPLGSCTMKLNPASTMIPITMPNFMGMHPLAPIDQAEGYMDLLNDLKHQLAVITGFAATCLQPTSGAAGEYTGLITIRDYIMKQNGGVLRRNVLLIPASAHGTNPASCVQAGFVPVVVRCDELGNTDLNDWREKAQANRDVLAGCMITYPSTHGIFEQSIRQMCQIIHECGGQVYMDGANMNAQIGYTNPATIGADVCHLNLHKSFASPHGGGGPGVGAICCAEHLVASMPSEEHNRVSQALYGNANMALISYGYIRMMGEEGLREATATAILSANYMAEKLRDAYGIVYTGETGRVGHELILDCRQFHGIGITESDIAKRLMDYGYHAPTLSFPVHGTLMVEPTESESKHELDQFIDALLQIRQEIHEIETGEASQTDNLLLNAPHPEYAIVSDEWNHTYSRTRAAYPTRWVADNKFWIPVARVDNGWGDRNLIAKFN